jgi:hypothetical protein
MISELVGMRPVGTESLGVLVPNDSDEVVAGCGSDGLGADELGAGDSVGARVVPPEQIADAPVGERLAGAAGILFDHDRDLAAVPFGSGDDELLDRAGGLAPSSGISQSPLRSRSRSAGGSPARVAAYVLYVLYSMCGLSARREGRKTAPSARVSGSTNRVFTHS